MKLELGSGYNPTPGYVHLDLNPNAPDVDVVAGAFPLPWGATVYVGGGYATLDAGSCEEIRAVDVLEHLSYWVTDDALAEWARALVPGGLLYVQVPDVGKLIQMYVGTATNHRALIRGLPEGLPQTKLAGFAWRLLGGHSDGKYAKDGDDWRWNAHYALFTRGSLTTAIEKAGLVVQSMETNAHPNLLAWAVKP